MKATAERSPVELTGRSLIAGEVRAVLARKNLNSNTLPAIAGRTQTYWYSRLNAKVSFSADDLAALSAALNVPMSDFVPHQIAPHTPTDDAPIDINTRRKVGLAGYDPTTSTVEYGRFATIHSLAAYRTRKAS